jgi:acetyl-CoA carboxylase carboxyltransferase component
MQNPETMYDMVPYWKSTYYADPNNWLGELYGSRYAPVRNVSSYKNPEVDKRVERAYESAKAVNAAAGGGLDDVIDPTDTRSWIVRGLQALPPVRPREGKKYPYIDPW